MGMLNRWLSRRLAAQGQVPAEPESTTSGRPVEGPLTPRLAQQQRIWQKAVVYRQQRDARLKAQAVADAQEEQERIQRARDEYEDRMARAMALGPSAFPGDGDDDVRGPRIVSLPVPQQWIDFQRECADWRGDRG